VSATPAKITSVQSVLCPGCSQALFFTDVYDDFELHHRDFPQSEVLYQGGIDMGAWRPGLQLRVKGRLARVTRTDLSAFYVYPLLCPKCHKMMVAHLFVTNAADVQRYEETVRPQFPPKREGDEVEPKWGMVAFGPRAFLDELREIRNPMVRAAVIRKLQAAGWQTLRTNGQDVSIETYVQSGRDAPADESG
jgi:hypothetical protein